MTQRTGAHAPKFEAQSLISGTCSWEYGQMLNCWPPEHMSTEPHGIELELKYSR